MPTRRRIHPRLCSKRDTRRAARERRRARRIAERLSGCSGAGLSRCRRRAYERRKAAKDLRQAAELLEILVEQRPFEVRDLWRELMERGPKWRQHALEAVAMLEAATGSGGIRQRLRALVGDIGE
jgi:hypothetical protein